MDAKTVAPTVEKKGSRQVATRDVTTDDLTAVWRVEMMVDSRAFLSVRQKVVSKAIPLAVMKAVMSDLGQVALSAGWTAARWEMR